MNDATPVLECRNLSISYYVRAGEIPAVVDFNLKLMPGESHGIVGESGCGKSTVALAVMNYMGKNGGITNGEILFEGRDMRTMSQEELRQIRGSKISMVYQEPMASLNSAMRIGEQLAEVPPVTTRRRPRKKRPTTGRSKYSPRCACPIRRGS